MFIYIYYHVQLNIMFRLDGELLFFTCLKKSNQKKGHPGRSCFAYPQPSSLPTGRLDSPSGLDKTRLTIPGQPTLSAKLSSASLTGGSVSP